MDQIKLNLGCFTKRIDGYTNIDKDAHPGVDIVSDVSRLPMFKDDSVDVIRASHILEHFPHVRTVEVLTEWKRMLKPNGLLYISVPDFDRAVQIYNKAGLQDWLLYFLYGEQFDSGYYHYTIFNFNRLSQILKNVGFSEVFEIEKMPDAVLTEASLLTSNVDKLPISLNVVATK